MKKFFCLLLGSIPFISFSQVNDSFGDGDFSSKPTWSSVNTSNWVIDNGRLRSNAQTTNTSFYISTPSTHIKETQWEFFTQLQFNTSGANYVDIFLTADNENLSLVSNGYFIRIGGTPDEISLYKMQGGLSTILINGRNGSTNKSNNTITVKVKHTLKHEWTLERDTTGTGQLFFVEGSAIDSSINLSTHFGIRITQSTASFFNKHFFDDIKVEKLVSDTLGPTISKITPLGRSSLLLNFNEKVSGESATKAVNYQVNNDNTCIAATLKDDEQSVELLFERAFINAADNRLKAINIDDLLGNWRDSTFSSFFFFEQEPITKRDIIFSEILADPIPSQGLPEAEYTELYNRSNKIINTANLILKDASISIQLPSAYLYPSEYIVITSSSAITSFATNIKILGPSSFPTLSNAGEWLSITNSTGETIDSITYTDRWYGDDDKKAGGYSLERVNQENTCLEDVNNWLGSRSAIGGSPGLPNSILDNSPDLTPPSIQYTQVLSNHFVEIIFSEKLNPTSVLKENFHISPERLIHSVLIDTTFFTSVQLKLVDALVPSQVYTLSAVHVSDCSGNSITGDQQAINLVLPEEATPNDIVISEIFADPTPSVALPAAEFVEIYNRSEKIIDLHNYQISDGNSIGTLPEHLIFPKAYVLLVSNQLLSLFNSEHKAIAVQNFPTLNNDGELLTLKNEKGITIDSVDFKRSWYRDEDKAEGGWSLERIDLENFCLNAKNWAASEDNKGGSPGRTNAIAASLPDQMGPKLIAVTVENTQTLVLSFDERLSPDLPSIVDIRISPLLEIERLSFTSTTLQSMKIHLSQNINEGIVYEVETQNIYDCAGNKIDESHRQAEFILPQEAIFGDVLINEILFNPRSGGVDFVEIYNTSAKYLSLKRWQVGNLEDDTTINNKIISDKGLILRPYSYLVVTSDTDQLHNHYPQGKLETFVEMIMPSFPDEEGTVAISDSLGNIFDFFRYSDEMHNPLLKDEEGVSLERISMTASTNQRDNWRSGVLATNFATPGVMNANSTTSAVTNDEVMVEPEIFEPIVGQPNFTSIHYKFAQAGLAANAKVFDSRGREIKQLANNQLLAAEGFFTWDGDQEDGTKANVGYYTLWLEVFDTNGFVKIFRKRIVIATRF